VIEGASGFGEDDARFETTRFPVPWSYELHEENAK
jgi:hypothetical protein